MIKLNKIQNYALILVFFSINFEVWDPLNTGGFFSLSKLTALIYFITISFNFNKFIFFPKKVRGTLILLSLFYILLIIMNSLNINGFSSDFLSMSILLNIFIFILIINHERLVSGIIEKAFIGYLIGALLTVIAFYLGIGVEIESDGRVTLFGDNQNLIGIRMVVAMFFLTHIIIKCWHDFSKLVVLAFSLLYIPLTVLLINTGSRVSTISLFLGAVVFIALNKFKNKFIKVFVVLFFFVTSGAILDFILNAEVVGERLIKTIEEGNLAGRDDIWRAIWPLIQDNVLLGVGQTGYIDLTLKTFGRVVSPHNVILEVLSYTGIIGLSFYLLFIYKAFLPSVRYYFKYGYVIPLLFAIPVAGILLSGQILTFKLGWFIFSYAVTRKYYI